MSQNKISDYFKQKDIIKAKVVKKEEKVDSSISKDQNEKKINLNNQKQIDVALNNNEEYDSFDAFINPLDTWKNYLSTFINSNKMKNIFSFVQDKYKNNICFPPKNQIFNAFNITPWENLKVVIIGQDPYFNDNEAMGLCFSVNKGVAIPPSLNNIYKALIKEKFIDKKPSHGDLSSWAKQGVLLLNSTLTVQKGKANAHQKESGWQEFTDYVIKTIDQLKNGIIFVLWGGFAIKKKLLITSGNSHIIENIHPSPLAAKHGDFAGKEQFKKINDLLKEQGKDEIDWSIN